MTYDPVDSDDDGVVESDVDATNVDANNARVGSLNTDEINSVLWADEPDDVQAQLEALPETGGTVRLVPGKYGDGHADPDGSWSSTITIPQYNNSQYTIDLSGSHVDIDSFGGPYLQKPSNNDVNPAPRHIYGPDRFDVNGVADPGDIMDLYDIESSFIWWPHMDGPVDSIIRKRANKGSGHMNVILVSGRGMQKGIVIGDSADDQTSDRSFWYGQLGGIEDVGVHVIKGQANHFYVQPEVNKTGFSATGYKIEWGDNFVYNNHSGTDTPFDIRANTFIQAESKGGLWNGSRFATELNFATGTNTDNPVTRQNFVDDPIPNMTTQSPSDGETRVNGFSDLIVDAGSTDGEAAVYETPGRPGNIGSQVYVTNSTINFDNMSEAVYRYGLREDADNHAMFVADPVNNTNWHVEVVTDGTAASNIDTGVPLSTGTEMFCIDLQGQQQRFGIFADEIESGFQTMRYDFWEPDADVSGFDTPKVRFDITVNGSPASNRRAFVGKFNFTSL